jgi:hypothetical protein
MAGTGAELPNRDLLPQLALMAPIQSSGKARGTSRKTRFEGLNYQRFGIDTSPPVGEKVLLPSN